MSEDSGEKRASHRFLAGVNTILSLGDEKIECQAVDFNRSGVLIEGSFSLGDRTDVSIALESPTRDLVVEANAQIANTSFDEATGRTRLGLIFEIIDADQTRSLELLISRVIEGMSPAPLAHLTRKSSIGEIRDALNKIPLAHKITLAKRALPLERGFLRNDDSYQVIEALCRNPMLTMPEVIQILRMPGLLPTTLTMLSRDSRWTANEEVKISIATHPRVSFEVAEELVETLGIVAIRKIIRRPGLHPAIKNKLIQRIPNKQLQSW